MHTKNKDWFFFFVASLVGLIFLRSSYGKLVGGKFVSGLGGTLKYFASENPHIWVKTMLTDVMIPHSVVLGYMTMWGEFISSICILVPVGYYLAKRTLTKLMCFVLGIGLLGGAFLNWTFWFASSWTSASADSLNLLMALIQTVGLVFVIKQYRSAK